MVLEHSCASRDVNILKGQLQLWSREEAPCINAAMVGVDWVEGNTGEAGQQCGMWIGWIW